MLAWFSINWDEARYKFSAELTPVNNVASSSMMVTAFASNVRLPIWTLVATESPAISPSSPMLTVVAVTETFPPTLKASLD